MTPRMALLIAALASLSALTGCGNKNDNRPASAAASGTADLRAAASTNPAPPAPENVASVPPKPAADAAAVSEAHADWMLNCGASPSAGTAPDCAVSQQQFDKATNTRILAIALNPAPAGGVKGVLVMPLGLALDKGITLQVDAAPPGAPLRFHTCVPTGCLVNLDLPEATVKALRSATTLKIAAVADGGQPAPFTVSMNGFASGLDRAIALTTSP